MEFLLLVFFLAWDLVKLIPELFVAGDTPMTTKRFLTIMVLVVALVVVVLHYGLVHAHLPR
jgi:hypothetical protein